MDNHANIEKLKEFNKLINDHFNGNYENQKEIKSKINYLLKPVQQLVLKADCLKLMTMAPPPAIGGMIMQNFNPFDMIFTNFWGISIIPDISDMIEQAIGQYENNLVKSKIQTTQNKENRIEYPKKLTLRWLLNHVPFTIWVAGVGLLVSVFVLGIQYSYLFEHSISNLAK
jgi:hypothetical protein